MHTAYGSQSTYGDIPKPGPLRVPTAAERQMDRALNIKLRVSKAYKENNIK
jgi:hypothetical protein